MAEVRLIISMCPVAIWVWLMRKEEGLWRLMVDYQRTNNVVQLIAVSDTNYPKDATS